MRAAAGRGDAARDEHAVADDQRADRGARRCEAEAAPPERERGGHEAGVLRERVSAHRGSASDFPGLIVSFGGSSGPPSSSPTRALKSPASRDFRETTPKRT